MEKVHGITLEIEILKSRTDSLQAFVNTHNTGYIEEIHEKQIEQLERELREGEFKTKRLESDLLESDLLALERKFFEFTNSVMSLMNVHFSSILFSVKTSRDVSIWNGII